MENRMYELILADGTRLTNLRMNGSNFISSTPLEPSVFEGNLSNVILSDGETQMRMDNAALVHVSAFEGGTCFALRELSREELWKMKMEADLEYIAMMSNVDLEEEGVS